MKATTGGQTVRRFTAQADAFRRRHHRAAGHRAPHSGRRPCVSATRWRWCARPRPNEADAPPFVKECISWGAGPRASQYLILGAKARAALYGRNYATTDDVAAGRTPAVLRHRILTNFNAEAEGITPDTIVERLLKHIPKPTEPG